jgi:IS5 family transposase
MKLREKLSAEQKESNRNISRIRSRVEHVFGDMKSFGGNFIRSVGFKRAELSIFLSIFIYNLRRFTYLQTK